MTTEQAGSQPRSVRLFPHQAAFVETFFAPGTKRILLLRGRVGLGKTTAIAVLAGRLLREQPAARVLILVPAALGRQYVELVQRTGVAALWVDRFKLRELLDRAGQGDLWPQGSALVLSADFAKLDDVVPRLRGIQWDLVIADEVHWFTGMRAELLRGVAETSTRVVLSTLTNAELPEGISSGGASVVDWGRDSLADGHGQRLHGVAPPIVREVPFTLTEAESSLERTLRAQSEALVHGTGLQLMAESLLSSLQSSPAALENALRMVQAGAADVELPLDPESDALPNEGASSAPDRAAAEAAERAAGRVLHELEAVREDSKLDTFTKLLENLVRGGAPGVRIAVLTDYLSTLFYLAAEVHALGREELILHSGSSVEDRERTVAALIDAGRVLVATRAGSSITHGLSGVTDLVLYDLPRTKDALMETIGAFDSIGRVEQLRVHALVPTAEIARGSIELLRGSFPSGPGPQG